MSFRDWEISDARNEQAKREGRQVLEMGMLVVDPNYHGRPQLWIVSRVAKKSTTLIAHYGTCSVEAKVNAVWVPEGWKVLDGQALAREAMA